uniref:Uncharacterized protein LOC114346425 n=1 Tax=Diabrotica virgifera virgifera TaxID=50390 RepID=A0A6P7HAU2_DIAVI
MRFLMVLITLAILSLSMIHAYYANSDFDQFVAPNARSAINLRSSWTDKVKEKAKEFGNKILTILKEKIPGFLKCMGENLDLQGIITGVIESFSPSFDEDYDSDDNDDDGGGPEVSPRSFWGHLWKALASELYKRIPNLAGCIGGQNLTDILEESMHTKSSSAQTDNVVLTTIQNHED